MEALDQEDIICRDPNNDMLALVVHVKTRLAQTIPLYPFEQMAGDERILKYTQYVERKKVLQ